MVMGRWGRSRASNKAHEPREKPRGSRSGSYSDDYRITPELQAPHAHRHAHKTTSDARGLESDACCSQDERCCEGRSPCCSQDERCFSSDSSPRYSPRRGRSASGGSRRGSFGGLDVVVVDQGHVDLRRPALCTSCESCESCHWTGESITRIELKNNLFTSPMHSEQIGNYDYCGREPSPTRARGRESSPTRARGRDPTPTHARGREATPTHTHNSPHRRCQTTESDEQRRSGGRRGTVDDTRHRMAPQSRVSRNGSDARVAGRRNTANTRRTPSAARDPAHGRVSRKDEHRSRHRSDTGVPALEVVGTRPPSLYSGQPDPLTSDLSKDQDLAHPSNTVASPERKTAAAGDGGGSGSRGSRESRGSPVRNEEGPGKMSLTLSKRDLLNQMVTQTKQHRQQIRSLENELERLRSGDMLNKCEVSVSGVEWRPGDVVGEGSFSTVYRGAYCGTEVAVKELKFKLSQDDKNYFRSEAALLQQLHHPRIVLLMGVCTGAARPFMLLEYLSGGTLYNLIHTTTRERLDHAAYFVVAKDVAQGMNYLHRHEPQVLHLDLKSMNVLLDSYYRAKIADFGFSILRRSRTGSPAQHGSIRGTPAWMAPELLTQGEVSAKCDVYSYAIILWEMLAASHPFKGLDIFQIMETIEAGGRPPLPSSGVSRELKELITSCWAQNPSLRPSFEEILGALESAAVPASWRGVLHKANITPSLLSDVTAARTIIGVVEQSVELMRRSLQLQRANSNRHQDQVVKGQLHHHDSVDGEQPTPARHTTRDDKGGKLSRSPRDRSKQARRSSPSKQSRLRELTPVRQSLGRSSEQDPQQESVPYKNDRRRSPDKRLRPLRSDSNRVGDARESSIDQPRGKKGLSRDRRRNHLDENSPESKDRRRGNGHSSENKRDREGREMNARDGKDRGRDKQRMPREKMRQSRDRGVDDSEWDDKCAYDRGQRASRQAIAQRNSMNKEKSSHDRRSNSLESHIECVDRRFSTRDQHSSGNERRFSSSDRHSELRREIRRRKFYSRERQALGEKNVRVKRNSRHPEQAVDSRDSLGESPEESWTSLEGSSSTGSNNVLDDPDDHHLVRRYSASPRRLSPERRYSPAVRSPEHNRRSPDRYHNFNFHHSPERRHSPRSPQRRSRIRTPETRRTESGTRLGPMVTSEQLMSQKQRLRPVRPSALSDLTHMPEHSLNDISLILKTAITKRRDAFEEGLSGRDTYLSDDIDWSDWH
ncbi:uncharacterized protein [Procambarus clarkii]|uniref:uncharacterized protein n=1 Tax=Procambarus clarkii TaxID=6728 RepID=UPI0037428B24